MSLKLIDVFNELSDTVATQYSDVCTVNKEDFNIAKECCIAADVVQRTISIYEATLNVNENDFGMTLTIKGYCLNNVDADDGFMKLCRLSKSIDFCASEDGDLIAVFDLGNPWKRI